LNSKKEALLKNDKTQRVLLWWIIYRGIKIFALYFIFREHPIIWVPTVITTTFLFYLNIRGKSKNLLVEEDSKNYKKEDEE